MTAGQVFTPVVWARWLVETHGVVDAWLAGARVMDPTAGDGSFLAALIESGIARGASCAELPLERLVAIERDGAVLAAARTRLGVAAARIEWHHADALTVRCPPADVLVGNPPWVNFSALLDHEKARLKPLFHEHGLNPDSRALLWGSARVDLAALILARARIDLVQPHGRGVFFAPLSLLLNDGASRGFRARLNDGSFALRSVHDFRRTVVFAKVGTRYGVVEIERDATTEWPIACHVDDEGNWTQRWAAPVDGGVGPLGVEAAPMKLAEPRGPTALAHDAPKPRQGVNACGATEVFVFDGCEDHGPDEVLVENTHEPALLLPRELVHPLVTTTSLGDAVARRWILLPHARDGRPLSRAEVEARPYLRAYLERHEERLRARRGPVLRRYLEDGRYWALLGVGPYAFAPFKVLWQSYGNAVFAPRVLDGSWQANQAMHAYLPAWSREEAEALLARLVALDVATRLAVHRMEGTKSYAQPGAIARLLREVPRA